MPPRQRILTRRWEIEMEEQRQCIARQQAKIRDAHRTIWMLVKENGSAVILNKDTKESYPGDGQAHVEVIEQSESGATIFRALGQSTPEPK